MTHKTKALTPVGPAVDIQDLDFKSFVMLRNISIPKFNFYCFYFQMLPGDGKSSMVARQPFHPQYHTGQGDTYAEQVHLVNGYLEPGKHKWKNKQVWNTKALFFFRVNSETSSYITLITSCTSLLIGGLLY